MTRLATHLSKNSITGKLFKNIVYITLTSSLKKKKNNLNCICHFCQKNKIHCAQNKDGASTNTEYYTLFMCSSCRSDTINTTSVGVCVCVHARTHDQVGHSGLFGVNLSMMVNL